MRRYLVDLHIHSLLSPCGDLEMSPDAIIRQALRAELDAIAVCDHNATQQTPLIHELGQRQGITVFYGAELTSREEAHSVALLPDAASAAKLQQWINTYIIKVKNNPERLGDQVWVDERQRIAGSIDWYLNAPIDRSVEQIAAEVVRLGGLFVPAHLDRQANSLIGQLGFLSPELPIAAVEYNYPERFAALKKAHPYLENYTAYTASDAHFPTQIGSNPSWLYAERCDFGELRKAFAGAEGRKIVSRRTEP